MLCEPSDVRGKAGTGSVLSLDAIGRQEAFLLGSDSYFKFEPKRHTNFTSYQSSIRIRKPAPVTSQGTGVNPQTVLNWPFGQTIVIDDQLKPQSLGDLLKNIYLKCTLPFLEDSVQLGSKYCDQVGRAIVKTITFTVDGIEVEKIYSDWNIIRDQLFTTDEEKTGLQYLINGGQPEGTLPSSNVKAGPIDLFVPMNFFFSNNDSTFFPLCAILNQKIKIVIEFNPVSFFSDTHTRDVYPDANTECSLPFFDLVFDQIALSPDERLYLQAVDHKLLIETVRKQPTLEIPPGTVRIKNFLVPNIPVETFHWFFRRSVLENALTTDAALIFNRYNFSSNVSPDLNVQALYPVLSDAKFFMNGQSQLGFLEDGAQDRPQTSYYFKYVEAMSANLSSPTRNVYTYSFALDPMHEPLTGAMDFSQLIADKTFIDTSILTSANKNTYIMHMYYTGLVTLTFSGGFMKVS
jgi:hypothetical protein